MIINLYLSWKLVTFIIICYFQDILRYTLLNPSRCLVISFKEFLPSISWMKWGKFSFFLYLSPEYYHLVYTEDQNNRETEPGFSDSCSGIFSITLNIFPVKCQWWTTLFEEKKTCIWKASYYYFQGFLILYLNMKHLKKSMVKNYIPL